MLIYGIYGKFLFYFINFYVNINLVYNNEFILIYFKICELYMNYIFKMFKIDYFKFKYILCEIYFVKIFICL